MVCDPLDICSGVAVLPPTLALVSRDGNADHGGAATKTQDLDPSQQEETLDSLDPCCLAPSSI